jgi:7-cyano-7-deazaguanine synthase
MYNYMYKRFAMYNKKAVVLLSGGLDSATSAAIAISQNNDVYALTFNYGQRHSIELNSAKAIGERLNIKSHKFIDIPVEIFESALTSSKMQIPKNEENIYGKSIPSTYVPARNLLFLSFALAYAESLDAAKIFIGANSVDYSGYPDCRPDFFQSFQKTADLGTKRGIEGKPIIIEVPLQNMEKSEIIKLGLSLGVDYSLTHSCYDPNEQGFSCGECESCIIRKKGFKEAQVSDPTKYYTKN